MKKSIINFLFLIAFPNCKQNEKLIYTMLNNNYKPEEAKGTKQAHITKIFAVFSFR